MSTTGPLCTFSSLTRSYFEINTLTTDNVCFQLYYKWSSTLFIISSILVTTKQFFGSPLQCDAGHASAMVDKDVLEAYCWMYSTFSIPLEYQGQCSAGELEETDNNLVYNSYYQWVPLYLISMSLLFYLPRILWLSMEGGLMKFFGKGSRFSLVKDHDEEKEMLINYFQQHVRNRSDVYFYGFVACEVTNLCVVFAFFFFTHSFLNYRFLGFGLQVLEYYRLPAEEQMVSWIKNPLCKTFPRVASCDYFRYGPGGGPEKINSICILSLNIINDKAFISLNDTISNFQLLFVTFGIDVFMDKGCRIHL
ncbi:innexin inx2 [Eurytemora carolleeae]|uniref:innexin inx2 n=1 Tax=Eurytemora carolleeae TaxID=1294199 RepID=UPI000C77FB3B|nr:innexin inx2 [Eurytemora carolleeae]|eukprot:XP_023336665.1 innexin inx2-like [Eurytemora affinis]